MGYKMSELKKFNLKTFELFTITFASISVNYLKGDIIINRHYLKIFLSFLFIILNISFYNLFSKEINLTPLIIGVNILKNLIYRPFYKSDYSYNTIMSFFVSFIGLILCEYVTIDLQITNINLIHYSIYFLFNYLEFQIDYLNYTYKTNKIAHTKYDAFIYY